LIRSGDIRDQSRKLLKALKILVDFLAAGIVKIVPNLSPLPRGALSEKVQ